MNKIIRIKEFKPLQDYKLFIVFDDNKKVIYDMNKDIQTLPNYNALKDVFGLFNNAKLDSSRTSIEWNDYIDLPSEFLYEYGVTVDN